MMMNMWRLYRSLLKCPNNDARTEAEIIDKNRPELFIDKESTDSTIIVIAEETYEKD